MDYLWDIHLYTNEDGVCYAENDLFKALSKRNPLLLERLLRKQEKFQSDFTIKDVQKVGLLEHVRDGVWELKFHLKQEVRYLGYLSADEKTFYVLAAFIKKDQKLKELYTQKAIERLIYLRKYNYEHERITKEI